MSDAAIFLKTEVERIGKHVGDLESQLKSLKATRDHLAEKMKEVKAKTGASPADKAAFDKALERLKIEDEQTAEHVRWVEHQLSEASARFDSLADDLAAIQSSSIT